MQKHRLSKRTRDISGVCWFYLLQQYSLFIATVFIVFAACALFGNLLISAHEKRSEEPVNFKYYKSIEIQPGDTLWDIAEEYITEDYRSVSEYVMVLKEMNSLSTDDIQAGQNLMIAYNDTEFINK